SGARDRVHESVTRQVGAFDQVTKDSAFFVFIQPEALARDVDDFRNVAGYRLAGRDPKRRDHFLEHVLTERAFDDVADFHPERLIVGAPRFVLEELRREIAFSAGATDVIFAHRVIIGDQSVGAYQAEDQRLDFNRTASNFAVADHDAGLNHVTLFYFGVDL